MAKKFAWDEEEIIGEVLVSEKEKRETSICKLDGKMFVSIKKIVHLRTGWKIISNATFPVAAFSKIALLVDDYVNTLEEVKK